MYMYCGLFVEWLVCVRDMSEDVMMMMMMMLAPPTC